jgi:hypothetical protein
MSNILCPRCGEQLLSHAVDRASRRCLVCGWMEAPLRAQVTAMPIANRTIRRETPPLSTLLSLPGEVVGLKTVSEAYIEGEGFVSGSQSISGYYQGAHGFMTPTGRQFPASGHLYGHGSLIGRSSLRTRYTYETRFFLRCKDGMDRPFRFPGVEYMPVLEGHTLSAIWCTNDRGRPLLVALVNHSIGQRPMWVVTEAGPTHLNHSISL